MTQPPRLPPYRQPESYPHRFSVFFLNPAAEEAFLRAVLQALGFEARLEATPKGQSGLAHASHVLGVDAARRHAVICQTGFQAAFVAARPTTLTLAAPPSRAEESLSSREDRIRRELLFAGYDLKAKAETDGWTTDVLYFLNATSPEEGGHDLESLTKAGPEASPPSVSYSKAGSTHPILRIPLAELRRNALSTGACFIELSDVQTNELATILQAPPGEVLAATQQMLRRLRLPQYFRPPADELLLGALAKSPQGLPSEALVAAHQVSSALQHPPSEAQHISPVDYRDPLAVVRALEADKKLRVKGSLAFTTEAGAQVAYEFEKSPEDSWVQKVLKLLPLAKFLTGGQ